MKSKLNSIIIHSVKNSIKYFLSLTITLILFEIFLDYSKISVSSIVDNHPKLGRVFRPNATIFSLEEGLCLTKINSYGYLGPEYSHEKQKNCIRIALVGDSYVEGFQLFERNHFRTILEKELSKLTNQSIEVLNFGMAGSDIQKMYLIKEELISKFNPDITLFFICSDDFLHKSSGNGPYFIVKNNSLTVNLSFVKNKEYIFAENYKYLRNLVFYSLIQKAYSRYKSGSTRDILLGKFSTLFNHNYKKNEQLSEINPQNDSLFQINKLLLKKIIESENDSSKNIFVIRRELCDSYRELFYKLDGKIIDLNPTLNNLRNKGQDPYYWKATNLLGHWNHIGHAAVGKKLAYSLYPYILNYRNTDVNELRSIYF